MGRRPSQTPGDHDSPPSSEAGNFNDYSCRKRNLAAVNNAFKPAKAARKESQTGRGGGGGGSGGSNSDHVVIHNHQPETGDLDNRLDVDIKTEVVEDSNRDLCTVEQNYYYEELQTMTITRSSFAISSLIFNVYSINNWLLYILSIIQAIIESIGRRRSNISINCSL